MIVCVGEILADMIGRRNGKHQEYSCYAGGAPFNVACGIARLGGNVRFYGRVGADEVGKFLLETATAEEGLKSHIIIDTTRNTTLAFVTLSEDGERNFSFARKHTADYAFDSFEIEELIDGADIVHIGSLILSEEKGRMFAKEVAKLAKAKNKKISFDVNYREDVFKSTIEAKRIYEEWLYLADILKLSEEEVKLFFGAEEEGLKKLSHGRKVFVTLGKKGSVLYENGKTTKEESIQVTPVDTTGAGDGFYAGVLAQLDAGEKDCKKILRFANVCGALATEKYGALDGLPSYTQVLDRL